MPSLVAVPLARFACPEGRVVGQISPSGTTDTAESHLENRLAELEVRLSLSEDLVEALNMTVYRQQQQIDLLQQQLRHLYRQLQDAPPASEKRSADEEIPPHY